MCGFVAIIGARCASLYGTGRPEFALDRMAHRGPDDRGMWWNESRNVHLGHRRLSIIDLSRAGHQPMSSEDGRLHLVYNGEVYNFPELRAKLEQSGHHFVSATDSEVILHGYDEYGTSVVEHLRGMFSFAIYDERKETLLLARDRVGIKPLYYTVQNGTLYASSEIKALLAFQDVPLKLNRDAMNEYLAFGKVYPPDTMFSGIYKLQAGFLAEWDKSGVLRKQCFWTPYGTSAEFPPDADETWYAARLRTLLVESVRLRMMSDVPVGVFLSGGVDSTTNVALMTELTGSRVHTFTAGFQGQSAYDEREWARKASRHYQTVHEECEVTREDLVDLLPELSLYLDEPIADPTVIPIYYVSKLARKNNAIVILNGDGGDELFCGYRKHAVYLNYHRLWRAISALPRPVKKLIAAFHRRFGGLAAVSELLDRSSTGGEFYIGATSALKNIVPFRELVPREKFDALFRAVNDARKIFDRERTSDSYAEWLSYWGLRSEVENVFLYRADRIGMANSIEIRVPFLDHRLVEFAMQIPQDLKYRNGETKYILKKAMKGTVPAEFLYRRKQGFCVPVREWSGGLMNDKIFRILPRLQKEWGVFQEGFLESVKRALVREDPDGAAAFDLYMLATWYERWFLS